MHLWRNQRYARVSSLSHLGSKAFLSVVAIPGSFVQVPVHPHTEKAKGLLLVRPFQHLFSSRLINPFLGTLFLMTGSSLMPLSVISSERRWVKSPLLSSLASLRCHSPTT